MIFSVILCCVLSVKVEALTIPAAMGEEATMVTERTRDPNEVYERDTTQLNGTSPRAPLWPQKMNSTEKILLLPRILKAGDEICVTAVLSENPQQFTASLVTEQYGSPDYNNIASQLYLNFTSKDTDNSVVLRTIQNGQQTEEKSGDILASELIPDDTPEMTAEVIIKLTVTMEGVPEVAFSVDDTYINRISLKHVYNNIRYIVLDGDVAKVNELKFKFP